MLQKDFSQKILNNRQVQDFLFADFIVKNFLHTFCILPIAQHTQITYIIVVNNNRTSHLPVTKTRRAGNAKTRKTFNNEDKIMKTQIFNLINGNKNVVRMENCLKYTNAKNAGTNREERAEVAAKVFAENGEKMKVTIRNVELVLRRGSSTTGKTQWYSCELTSDEYQIITAGKTYEWPADMKYKSFSLQINNNCTITATRFGKNSENAQWKAREWVDIDEAFCTIKE